MLRFSEELEATKKHDRRLIKQMPNLIDGINVEIQKSSSARHLLVRKNFCLNPDQKCEQIRVRKIESEEKKKMVHPECTQKINLQMVEEQKTAVDLEEERQQSPISSFSQAYYRQKYQSPGRFKQFQGESTNFIFLNGQCKKERWPMHGLEGALDKIKTRKQKWRRGNSETEKKKRVRDDQCLMYRIETACSSKLLRTKKNHTVTEIKEQEIKVKKSKLMGEKLRIRKSRDQISERFNEKIKERKRQCILNFRLQKDQEKKPHKYSRKVMAKTQDNELAREVDQLNRFETKLFKKFK